MKIRNIVVVTLLLAFLISMGTIVALADVTSYTSGFQLQNLEGTLASGTIHFYNKDGSEPAGLTGGLPFTITANSSKTYYPLSQLPDDFDGSVMVESGNQIAAIANVLGNNGAYGASYDGFSAGATTVNVPLVMKNNYGISTWLNVQNTGASDANVTIAYKPGSCTSTATIKVGAAATFDQGADGCLTNPFVGAATVTSNNSVPVAVTVMQVTSSSAGLKPSLLAYNGFTTASTNPVMPLVTSGYYNSGTGIQIQNTGSASTSVTISFTPSGGSFPGAACTQTKTVAAGVSETFAFPMPAACLTNAGSAGSAAFVGSASVTGNTASVPLVGVVNQVTIGSSTAGAYGAFDPAGATSKVSLPLIMDNNYGLFTGFSVANVGTQPTNISCSFSGSTHVDTQSNVAPGAAMTKVQNGVFPAGYVGSAICTATGGDAKIVGVVNELNPATVIPTEDGLSVYEGITY
jgi:hypothetical protein